MPLNTQCSTSNRQVAGCQALFPISVGQLWDPAFTLAVTGKPFSAMNGGTERCSSASLVFYILSLCSLEVPTSFKPARGLRRSQSL